MKAKQRTPIFFDDLTKKAQKRIVDEKLSQITEKEQDIRSIRIDKDLYGYNENPKKQTILQFVNVKDNDARIWRLMWNCEKAEFIEQ